MKNGGKVFQFWKRTLENSQVSNFEKKDTVETTNKFETHWKTNPNSEQIFRTYTQNNTD